MCQCHTRRASSGHIKRHWTVDRVWMGWCVDGHTAISNSQTRHWPTHACRCLSPIWPTVVHYCRYTSMPHLSVIIRAYQAVLDHGWAYRDGNGPWMILLAVRCAPTGDPNQLTSCPVDGCIPHRRCMCVPMSHSPAIVWAYQAAVIDRG